MEDKELQELFAAKRTAEANRRRQEELRRLLEASAAPEAAPKTRRLWPVWLSAAAAVLLLFLLTLPVLFRQPETAPLLTAQSETVPQMPTDTADTVRQAPTEADTAIPVPTKMRTVGARRAVSAIAQAETIPQIPTESADTAHRVPTETSVPQIAPTPTIETPLASNDEPRIHRRTSSNMVCSNCSITNVPTPNTALQNFLVATFGAEARPPLTLKNIEF